MPQLHRLGPSCGLLFCRSAHIGSCRQSGPARALSKSLLAHRPYLVFVFDAPNVWSAAAGSHIPYCLQTPTAPRGMSRVLVVLVAVLACVQQALAYRGGWVPVATPRNVCTLEVAGGENVTLHHVFAVTGCLDADCAKIANTADGTCNGWTDAGVGYCNCASGYFWSGKDVKCLSEHSAQTHACA